MDVSRTLLDRDRRHRANSLILDLVSLTAFLDVLERPLLVLLVTAMRRSGLSSSMIPERPVSVVPSTISLSRTSKEDAGALLQRDGGLVAIRTNTGGG